MLSALGRWGAALRRAGLTPLTLGAYRVGVAKLSRAVVRERYLDNWCVGFGERLEVAMAYSGVSAAQLARRCEVGSSTVAHWLQARANPQAELLRRICLELDLDPTWLLGIDKRRRPVDLEGETKR